MISPVARYNVLNTAFLGNKRESKCDEGADSTLKSGKLYHNIKKELLSPEMISNRVSDSGEYIGALPKEWILKFKGEDIGENTRRVFNIFSEFSSTVSSAPFRHAALCKYDNTGLYEKLRGKYRYMEPAPLWDKILKDLEDSLKEIFNDECEISYIDDGAFGIVFKVSIGDADCALKVYFNENDKTSATAESAHGAVPEILNAAHLSDTLKASQCAKFYCAKIPSDCTRDSFLLSKCEQKAEKTDYGVEQRLAWFQGDMIYWGRYTFHDCHSDNFINGKLIDFGDVEYTFSSKAAQEMAKKFFPMVQRGDLEGVLKFAEENIKTPEFFECLQILRVYMGEEEDLETPEDFAFHCISRKISKKTLDV